jgi:diacylglycerol kinase family enzyme
VKAKPLTKPSQSKPAKRKPTVVDAPKICCLVNQNSGTAGDSPGQMVKSLFQERGAKVRVIELKQGDDISSLALKAVAEGHDVIVSGGGDGTVNAVASALVGKSGVKFGVLPMGTYNHFAKDLVIPLKIGEAIDVILKGVTRPIDVGEVNGHIFVNNSSVGAYPAMVKLRDALQKTGYAKKLAAVRAWMQIIARFKTFRLVLDDGSGDKIVSKTAMLFIGNNRYELDPAQIGTRNSLTDGKLWVLLATSQSRWAAFASLFSVLWYREAATAVTVFETRQFAVKTGKRSQKISLDGEVLQLAMPLHYTIRPAALQIIVPGP